jgi:hypothetical protein
MMNIFKISSVLLLTSTALFAGNCFAAPAEFALMNNSPTTTKQDNVVVDLKVYGSAANQKNGKYLLSSGANVERYPTDSDSGAWAQTRYDFNNFKKKSPVMAVEIAGSNAKYTNENQAPGNYCLCEPTTSEVEYYCSNGALIDATEDADTYKDFCGEDSLQSTQKKMSNSQKGNKKTKNKQQKRR